MVTLRLVTAPGEPRVPARFSYDAADPYAVRAGFYVGLEEPVEWFFARDILAAGLRGRAGGGDVTVWPSGDGHTVTIELSSPFGTARFQAPAGDIAGFLEIAYDLVPDGGEPGHVNIDAELASLLAEG
jgi:hypothetical protein